MPVDGGASDGAFFPQDDGATSVPFDAGSTPNPTPTCKGLLELCSGQECCSPNTCVNGTCR